MDSKELQRPMTAHKKQISVVSSVERIVENGDAANGRPSLSRSVSITSGRHSGIELFPKPTDSPLDPLVHHNFPIFIPGPKTISNNVPRIGQNGKGNYVMPPSLRSLHQSGFLKPSLLL
jgi:hypothetical protein